jgi:hypothetical protein
MRTALIAVCTVLAVGAQARAGEAFNELAQLAGSASVNSSGFRVPAGFAFPVPAPLHGKLQTVCAEEGGRRACMDVLSLRGTPYEMGYAHGVLLKEKVKRSIAAVDTGMLKLIDDHIPLKSMDSRKGKLELARASLDAAWAKLAPFVRPEKLEELRGLAAGAEVPLQELFRLHALPDFSETSCSALVAQPEVTADHHVYQLRILDYGNFNLYDQPALIVYQPEHGHRYANIGWAGFIGVVTGINDQGVAVSEKGYGSPPGERLDGEPMPFVLEDVLRFASTADQAAAIARAARGTNRYYYFFGDPQGGAVGNVASAQDYLEWRPNKERTLKIGGEDFAQVEGMVFAGMKSEEYRAWLEAHRGRINEVNLRELTKLIAMDGNLHTAIYDLTAAKVWVANRDAARRAADNPYIEFDLAAAWRALSSVP